jgi:hypothetical protein
MVRERLVQGVAQVPAMRQVERGRLAELPLAPQPFEEEEELQLEEDHRIEPRAPDAGVAVAHELAHEREIERGLQVAVEVARRHTRLQRHRHRTVDVTRLRWPEQRQRPPKLPTAAHPLPRPRRPRGLRQ